MPEPGNADFSRRTEATATFQQELDAVLAQSFPNSSNQDARRAFLGNETHFCSFSIESEGREQVIIKSLLNALDQDNQVTYSHHGAEHKVFPEAVHSLISVIENRKYSAYPQPAWVKSIQEGKERVVPSSRLIVETPRYQRTVHTPVPVIKAKKMYGNIDDQLRKVAKTEGVASAILIAMHRRMEPKQILDLLGNAEFVKNTYGKNIKNTLHVNHPYDLRWLNELYQ